MLDINRWLLKVSGIWSMLNKCNEWKYIAHTLGVVLVCQFMFLPMEFVKLITSYKNVKSTVEQLGVVTMHTISTLKIVNLYFKRNEISRIIEDLHYTDLIENSGSLECRNIQTKFHMKIRRLCMFFFHMGNCTSAILCATSLIHLVICKHETDYQEFCSTVQPIVISTPIHIRSVIYSRWIINGFQWMCLFLYGWQIVAHDTLFAAILIKIACNVRILQMDFKNITTESDQNITKMNYKMNQLTFQLQKLIRTCQCAANIFQYIILLQVLSSLFILITCLYVAASVPVFGIEFVFQLQYYLTVVTQLSMYCWLADEVTILFSQMPVSIYQNNWICGDQSFKRSMLINMIRMNKPIYFIIGTVAPLNINVLVYILRASYSYFAIIKNK